MQTDHIKENLLKLPKISQIAANHAKLAKKSLGQNFLVDDTIARQIINSCFIKDIPVLEIGPGLGALTREIIYKSSGSVPIHVVEKDDSMMSYLEELSGIDSNLSIHHADALSFDEAKIASKLQIIANLPYNIGTQLLLKWLQKPELFASITVMLQQEVIKRLYAKPNTRAYGSLSIFVQVLCEVEHVLDVPPESFVPRPKVESAVIKLMPRTSIDPDLDLAKLERVVRACFAHKRKMIKKALNAFFDRRLDEVCKRYGIDPSSRPEQLSIADYINLSKEL